MQRLFSLLLLLFALQLGALAQHARTAAIDSLVRKARLQLRTNDTLSRQKVFKADTLFYGTFRNEELGLEIHLDPNQESLLAPSLEFLGPVHGYMHGGIYGVWMLVRHKIDGRSAELHFSNDMGSDAQTLRLTAQPDGNFLYEAIGSNMVSKAVGRRLVKISPRMLLRKKSPRP